MDIIESLEVVLVVATGEFEHDFDLESQKAKFEANDFHKADIKKPGLYVQRKEDSPTITLFPSGKYIIRASSEDVLFEENREFGKLYDVDVIDDELTISNIVGTIELDSQIKLNALSINLGLEEIEYYEPEQFPALSYKGKNSCTFLVFSTGKIVITGGVREPEMKEAAKDFVELINEHPSNTF